MKKKLITVLTLLLCGSLWFSACSEKEQTPARTAQYQMFFYAFEDIMKDSDVLFVGECIRAELKTPNAEYTRYTFRIERDLGENLYCEEIVYDMPNGVALGPRNYGTRIGEEFFSVGETYLLPMVCEEIVLERHYNLCTFGIRMNLTTGVHQLMGQTIETPEGMGIEEFALSEYRKYPHKSFSPPKEYASEFDETGLI